VSHRFMPAVRDWWDTAAPARIEREGPQPGGPGPRFPSARQRRGSVLRHRQLSVPGSGPDTRVQPPAVVAHRGARLPERQHADQGSGSGTHHRGACGGLHAADDDADRGRLQRFSRGLPGGLFRGPRPGGTPLRRPSSARIHQLRRGSTCRCPDERRSPSKAPPGIHETQSSMAPLGWCGGITATRWIENATCPLTERADPPTQGARSGVLIRRTVYRICR
jgi:hypothetical protein